MPGSVFYMLCSAETRSAVKTGGCFRGLRAWKEVNTMEFWIGLGFLMGQCALIAWDFSSRTKETGPVLSAGSGTDVMSGAVQAGVPDRLQMAWLLMDTACSQQEEKGRQARSRMQALLGQLDDLLLKETETEEPVLQGLYSHRLLLQSCLALAEEDHTGRARHFFRRSGNAMHPRSRALEALSLLFLQLPDISALQFQQARGQLLQAAGSSEALHNALLALQDLHAREQKARRQAVLAAPRTAC